MTFNCYKSEFSLNIVGFRRFGNQQRLNDCVVSDCIIVHVDVVGRSSATGVYNHNTVGEIAIFNIYTRKYLGHNHQ